MSVGTDLLAAPFPQMVRALGVGIAEAQMELDLVSLKIARMMAGYAVEEGRDDEGNPLTREPNNGFSVDAVGRTVTLHGSACNTLRNGNPATTKLRIQVGCATPCQPEGEEVCDYKDNNCDGTIDEGCEGCSPEKCDGVDNDCDDVIDNGCPMCQLDGESCAADGECCYGSCRTDSSVCGPPCRPDGVVCESTADCCAGVCAKTAGAQFGTCISG